MTINIMIEQKKTFDELSIMLNNAKEIMEIHAWSKKKSLV